MSKTDFTVKLDDLKVVMERVFDAPRESVFRAFIDSELIRQWWGPRNATTIVDKNEVRDGGEWRLVCRGPGGREDSFYGVNLKIQEPRLIKHTFNYEPIGPGHEITETATFEETDDDKTVVRTTSVYKTLEDLEGMVGAGMEAGVSESYDQLAELLAKTKNPTSNSK